MPKQSTSPQGYQASADGQRFHVGRDRETVERSAGEGTRATPLFDLVGFIQWLLGHGKEVERHDQ